MAIVTLLGFLPTLLFSVPAGVLADKYDRRVLMMVGDGCSAFGILYILLCMLRGNITLVEICIGVFETIPLITTAGFCFFMMLPFANTCLDYLVRTNTAKELQGRIWGLIGFVSQIGYVVAYACSGGLADWLAVRQNVSVGRRAGFVISISGVALLAVAVSILFMKNVRLLENDR